MAEADIEREIERRAKSDGSFAIAYAILQLADAQGANAKALQKLGNGNANTDRGAVESLTEQTAKLSASLDGIASAILDSNRQ
jgi:hypothetical protein